uniref:Secreted protein n=1 Tax=Caenorhabditis japonica TaxID=281687 RepID=A0A8R1ECR5_CAEJA
MIVFFAFFVFSHSIQRTTQPEAAAVAEALSSVRKPDCHPLTPAGALRRGPIVASRRRSLARVLITLNRTAHSLRSLLLLFCKARRRKEGRKKQKQKRQRQRRRREREVR